MSQRYWKGNKQLIPFDHLEAWMPGAGVQLSQYYYNMERRSAERFRKKFLKIWKDAAGHLQCVYCGRDGLSTTSKCSNPNQATLDHITPVSKGGERWDMTNIVPCCQTCNRRKNNIWGRNLVEWIDARMRERRDKDAKRKAKNKRKTMRKLARELQKIASGLSTPLLPAHIERGYGEMYERPIEQHPSITVPSFRWIEPKPTRRSDDANGCSMECSSQEAS